MKIKDGCIEEVAFHPDLPGLNQKCSYRKPSQFLLSKYSRETLSKLSCSSVIDKYLSMVPNGQKLLERKSVSLMFIFPLILSTTHYRNTYHSYLLTLRIWINLETDAVLRIATLCVIPWSGSLLPLVFCSPSCVIKSKIFSNYIWKDTWLSHISNTP